MYRDPSEFRERFKAYKDGKSVREIYGLPGYAPGKVGEPSPDEAFVESMGPLLYRELLYQGVKNPDVVYKNLIAQLAYESDRGRSRVAREQHNYGGVGWNGKTYFNYKNDADFVHDYVKLMNRRYKTAILADTLYDYAKGIKKLGYFEDTLENYSRNLIGMKSLHKAALAHKMANPELYKVDTVPVQLAKPIIAIPDATRVSTIPTIQLQAIDYSDRRNTVAADIDRTIWAHNVMEDMKGAYQVPIWESSSLPALTPVEYDVTPLKTYAGGKAAGEDEPVITQGRAGSRLERFRRSMDPDADDGTVTRVLKNIGRGAADLVLDAKKATGLETIDRFATNSLRPEDYIDAAFLTVGGAIISKMSKVSPIYMRPFIKSFDDMDAKAIGKYFFQEHPELINKPQEAWYGELAKKSDDYFKQAIERRVRLFDKAGKPLSPESIAAQVSPDLKVASMPGSKYGGVYSPADNTMLINNDRVKDPRTALRVYNHEKAHAVLTAFEDATGLPYPATYGAEMEGLFKYTPEYKAAHKGVHLGLETDASLHEGKSLAAYDKDILGNLLDIDFKNMTDEEFYKYMHNGYFKNLKLSIPEGAKKQKEFVGKLKDGKLPGYKDGTKIQWDADAGVWRQVMDDPYADVFNNLVVTPNYIRPKFEYETNPNYQQPNKNEVVKPDETLWTRQQVEKANNTRTWRSDVADAMKYVQYTSDIAGLLYGMTPGIKQRAAKAIYRNVVPASYKDSYLPGGKKQEVVNAIKDFFAPKKLDLDNSAYRKWEQENLSLFFTDTDPVAARDEIYRKYLGLPNDDFYYIKNADGTYSHNLANHEPHDIVTIINNTYNNDMGLSGKNQVLPDMLNSAGGWVNTSLKKANDIQARFKYNDVWDVNPFQDADRVGNVFPKKLLNKYSHIEKLANGEEVRVWNKDVPWFIKKLQNFELSDLTNGAPVPVKTDINVRLLNPEEYSYTKKLTDAQIIEKMKQLDLSNAYDYYGDAMSDGIISEAEWNLIELRVIDKVHDTFYKDPNKYRKMFVYDVNYPIKTLFDWYGPFVLLRGYKDGKISIKPSKRGTFTAAAKKHGASVREFESRVLKNPEKYSTAMVKKARFSRNARSWKH